MSGGIMSLAAHRLAQRPVRALGVALPVLAATSLLASGLLVLGAVEHTADRVVSAGPALVVNAVDAGGWASLPESAVTRVAAIPGVAAVRGRVWGILPGDDPVTLVGDAALPEDPPQVLVGAGVPGAAAGAWAVLQGFDGRPVRVRASSVLPPGSLALARDVVVAPEGLARRLLLLPPGHVTDIAVASVRPEEDAALVKEIADAFDGPVRVATRAQMRGAYSVQLGSRGGLWLLMALPALLGLALVVGQFAAGGPGARREAGQLKLLGWTTWDVARLHLYEALLPAGLATSAGLALSYAGVFLAGGGPAAALLLGFDRIGPGLALSPEAALLALAEVGAVVVLPCLLAALLPSARLARADPADLLEEP